MHVKEVFESKIARRSVCGVIMLIVLLGVFQLGMFVGFRKANFSYEWADSYRSMFHDRDGRGRGGRGGGFMNEFGGGDFTGGHGVAGAVVKVGNGVLIIKGLDGVEKLVTLKESSSIVSGKTQISLSDLSVGDMVVVLGSPTKDGSINGKIIRVFGTPMMQPEAPAPFSATTTIKK